MNYTNILIIGIGSFVGGISRFAISQIVGERLITGGFPWATFIINVSGCLLIGALTAIFQSMGGIHASWKLLLTVGFCGSFTTFSTFMNENFSLVRSGGSVLAMIYTLCSLICGMLALSLAFWGVRLIIK